MGRFPIGVIIDSFRTDTVSAVEKAASVGADGIQVYATRGEMAPENMNAQKRADFRNLVADSGLVISALCGDLGCGFANKDRHPELIEKSKRILDLSSDVWYSHDYLSDERFSFCALFVLYREAMPV